MEALIIYHDTGTGEKTEFVCTNLPALTLENVRQAIIEHDLAMQRSVLGKDDAKPILPAIQPDGASTWMTLNDKAVYTAAAFSFRVHEPTYFGDMLYHGIVYTSFNRPEVARFTLPD